MCTYYVLIGAHSPQISPQLNVLTSPPPKKIKRVNGYNLFFSNCVRTCPDISSGRCAGNHPLPFCYVCYIWWPDTIMYCKQTWVGM